MARRSDFLVSRVPLGGVENQPWESNFNSPATLPCREHSGSNKSAGARVQPASASCSRGAVTSQIPASLFIPFCSGSETPAVFTPALAGPAPRTRAARLQAAAAAALDGGGGGGGGACSPRAVPAPSGASQAPARSLPTAAFGRRMLPGSECYTYTFHSRHDSADLIHPRSPRCHWPGVTSGGGGASAAPIHNPRPAARCRLGAGSAGGVGGAARAVDLRCLFCSRREAPCKPLGSPWSGPGPGLRLLPPGTSAAQRRWPGNRGRWRSPGRAASAAPGALSSLPGAPPRACSGERAGSWRGCLKMEHWGEPEGWGEERKVS